MHSVQKNGILVATGSRLSYDSQRCSHPEEQEICRQQNQDRHGQSEMLSLQKNREDKLVLLCSLLSFYHLC